MTLDETATILGIFQTAYPTFYLKFSDEEIEEIVALWHEMFEEEDLGLVKFAVKDLIATHSGYPPDIAALKTKIKSIIDVAMDKPTYEELWFMLKKATHNGYYGAQEEFNRLPPILKRYVGSPGTLAEYAMIEEDVFNTVIHGQFLKQIKIIEEREEYSNRIPPNVKMLVESVYKPFPSVRAQLTAEEVNTRRNQIYDQLQRVNDEEK